jgi:hypothetical protein
MSNNNVEARPRTIEVFKTARFVVRDPSAHKRAALRYGMRHAHICFGRLLEDFMPDEEEVARLRSLTRGERRRELNALLGRLERATTRWRQLSIAAKASIAREAAATISSHIELKGVQEHAGVPTVAELKEAAPEYDAALDALKNATDLESENALRDELLRRVRRGKLRPLNFAKVKFSDGFLLLRNEDTGRICAWLNLFPANSRFAKPVTVAGMTNLQTGEIVSFKSRTGVLLPLEMGHAYHRKTFVDRNDGQRARPQSARLIYRQDEDAYELHVSFEWKTEAVETHCWLGVDRGHYNLAALTVVDDDGHVLAESHIDGRELRARQRSRERATAEAQRKGRIVRDRKRRAWGDHAVHNGANEIVGIALQHRAHVVLEDLSSLSGMAKRPRVIGRRRGGFNKLLGRRQFEKLASVITYKLRAVGLPEPVFVRAAGTSQTCTECGLWSADNRVISPGPDGFEMSLFKCVSCGHSNDADANAARVIGLKGAWLSSLPKNPARGADGRLAQTLRFETFLKTAGQRRKGYY